ncbi:MAG: CBS domain-containing protein [Phycisphaeraceae bacterium]|nr:CBS domain-containing protein [Phycisphaeraceae bacterium]MCB9847472.1 CBS domain-containing protein [Phycisphaeraceae bacterium]
MPKVSDLLAARKRGDLPGGDAPVAAVAPETTVFEAARRMNEAHVGSLVVLDGNGGLLGIFTERDVLRRVVADSRDPERTPVGDVMTRSVHTAPPETPLDDLRTLMREKRIRHVPIVQDGKLVGMVSIGDLNAAEARTLVETITYLERYMTVT